MIRFFTDANFRQYCGELAAKEARLQSIIRQYGHPPFWQRPPGFASLVHIILEQQVSLSSARAALEKLKAATGTITPASVLALSDAALRACYFSRQKTTYVRALAAAIETKELDLEKLNGKKDEHIRDALKKIKGIGDWTVDIYLLMGLQRTDVFPVGDLAMMRAFKEIWQMPVQTPRETIIQIAESWRPYRSMATMLLWHHYIQSRKIRV